MSISSIQILFSLCLFCLSLDGWGFLHGLRALDPSLTNGTETDKTLYVGYVHMEKKLLQFLCSVVGVVGSFVW